MLIRHPTLDDLAQCCHVESTCFLPTEAAPLDRIRKRIQQFPQGYLVVECDDIIIAHINSAAIEKDDITDEAFKDLINHDSDGKNIVIFSVAVLPLYRNRGIAAKLMSAFIDQSRDLNKQQILLLCKPDLVTFYESLGFTHRAKSTSTYGNTQWHEMYLYL